MTIDAHKEPRTKLHHRQERKKTPRSQPNPLLRQARQERCWSQADLAERVGVTNETISRWENGVNTPQPEQLKNLCEAFGKTPAELGYPLGSASHKSEETGEVSSSPVELGASKLEETGEVPVSPVELGSRKQRPSPTWGRWSRAIIVETIGLIIVLLVLSVVRFAPSVLPTSCGGTFFDGKLDSGWKWKSPSEKATYHVTPSGLTLSAPPYSDLSPEHNFDAPRFLRPITGNFTIETRLVFRPDTNFQSAGIVLWQDPNTFLRFERGFGGKNSGVLLQRWPNGGKSTITGLGKYPTKAGIVELRIQRQEDYITASWREPNQHWQFAGDTFLHFESLQIGVDLIDDFNRLQTTSAAYNYFTVVCA